MRPANVPWLATDVIRKVIPMVRLRRYRIGVGLCLSNHRRWNRAHRQNNGRIL